MMFGGMLETAERSSSDLDEVAAGISNGVATLK